MLHRQAVALAGALVAVLVAGCGGASTPETDEPVPPSPSATSASPAPTAPTPSLSEPPRSEPGTVPPDWLGTRVLPHEPGGIGEVRRTPRSLRHRRFTLPDQVPMLPGDGFASRVARPAPDAVIARSTWEPACPVARDDLSWVRVTFRGFDQERHTGELLVNSAVDRQVVQVFRALWEARFPIEQMVITRPSALEAPPTGDGNGTGAFVCRPITGGSGYSQHAYGLAIDINPFQNPYQKDDVVLPELASSYLQRARVRPGMITADGPVVRAFASIGWEWGGAWQSLKDYQHFSRNGR